MNNYIEFKQDIIKVAMMCRQSGMQTGNGGNLSIKIPNTEMMIIKASEIAFCDCTISNLAVATFKGDHIEGPKKPSRECLLHGALYKALPELGAIVHCHSPWATSWASTNKPLPFSTYHSEIKLNGEIVVFDTGSYIVPETFFPTILQIFKNQPKLRGFLLKGHGQVALGKNINDALYNAELIEETAHIAILSHLLHK